MDDWDSEWQRKGATLSDKTARKSSLMADLGSDGTKPVVNGGRGR